MKRKNVFTTLLFYFSFLFLSLSISSCKKDHIDDWNDIPASSIPAKLEGIWQSEGYGYVLDIKNGKAVLMM